VRDAAAHLHSLMWALLDTGKCAYVYRVHLVGEHRSAVKVPTVTNLPTATTRTDPRSLRDGMELTLTL